MSDRTSRTPISAGNWKMNGTNAEVDALCDGLVAIGGIDGVEVVLSPSFLQIARVAAKFEGSGVGIAGQNMHAEEKGAFTGEVSAPQLKEIANWVILGHSERRQLFGEQDSALNGKVQAALAHGLKPILCVGETLAQREAGEMEAVLQRQVTEGLRDIHVPDGFVVAYEPVWAIGTGKAATEVEAQEACAFVRGVVADVTTDAKAASVRVLYGGSVKPDNAATLAAQPDIDGALVGGAALDADAFLTITRAIAGAHASA
jgi:triosephosphate isomerase